MSLIATEILDHSGREDYRDSKFTRVLYTDSRGHNSRLKGVVKMLLNIHFTGINHTNLRTSKLIF